MEAALQLRLLVEKEERISEAEIDRMLADSLLVSKLTQEYEPKYLFNIFKLVALSEIPFIERLPYTQKVIQFINKNCATEAGFSYTGKIADIVPCYNAMLLEAYVRLGMAETKEAQAALNWIKNYQLFARNLKTSWTEKGICKHGGCLNKTPCYIGIGKTVRALITYGEYTNHSDPEVENFIEKGLGYMLEHQMFLRLSEETPISKYITDNAFPQSYALTATDLVYIVGKGKKTTNNQVEKLMTLINKKQIAENQWKIEYIYKYKGYLSFENRRGKSEWLSHLYPIWLKK
ncbi:hypothetical protein [Enterococcus rivorum]|uniref:Alginate lyase domain-containing protein n=1 Tax=Enterococcus rivorum TaxID=762845 RepID=A0A1E5KXH3_9ENTE|nr:hypothetical protein [Enterococcus rivorum]MBP2097289.1 hypothetical protein [Enterococcus rivorum]OEH82359.1 hypothetical protein BCR26_02710 [Enterococcus rivorum]